MVLFFSALLFIAQGKRCESMRGKTPVEREGRGRLELTRTCGCGATRLDLGFPSKEFDTCKALASAAGISRRDVVALLSSFIRRGEVERTNIHLNNTTASTSNKQPLRDQGK